MRVASLLPSATEIVYGLGVTPVAVSHECDYPSAARDRPAITQAAVEDAGGSRAVNEAVDRALRSAGGVYDIDLGVLERTRPELAIAQGICDVCAVDEVTIERAIEAVSVDVEVLTTDPHRMGDVLDDVERIGEAIGRADRATACRQHLERRLGQIGAEAETTGSRTVVFDWMDPVMVAGHWVPELIDLAGGRYGLADPGERSKPRSWEDIRAYDPETIIVAPCGFDVERTCTHLAELTERPGWTSLAAVERQHVYVIDGNHFVNRPGPRLVETASLFRAAIAGAVPSDRPADIRQAVLSVPEEGSPLDDGDEGHLVGFGVDDRR